LEPEEAVLTENILRETNLKDDIENLALDFAITQLVPQHYEEIKTRKEYLVEKTLVAVKNRLTKEINYWDHGPRILRRRSRLAEPMPG
jgi:hypothetical protein